MLCPHGRPIVVEPHPTYSVCIKRLHDVIDKPWEELHDLRQAGPLVIEDDELGLDLGVIGDGLGQLGVPRTAYLRYFVWPPGGMAEDVDLVWSFGNRSNGTEPRA